MKFKERGYYWAEPIVSNDGKFREIVYFDLKIIKSISRGITKVEKFEVLEYLGDNLVEFYSFYKKKAS